ncbi:CpsB/CapC family capsule biosynthesis tyrosine phosphatase [Clostridium sp.]|uniref:CpsB/CapC family capsule biosynthesis tyrosine phosphatase n=1 Tax=Clostridium sp. TaxID=1506 RepID=UPI003F2DF29E
MVDVNCQLLAEKTITESHYNNASDYIKTLSRKGIKSVVLTSEYSENGENISIDEMKSRVAKINEKLSRSNVNVKVYYGQVLDISENTMFEAIEGKVQTINNSKYILVDMKEDMSKNKIEQTFELVVKGFTPIIVSPERYEQIKEKSSRIEKLKEIGCLFQLDLNSLDGVYGKEAKKTAKLLLKEGIYDFMGTRANQNIPETMKLKHMSSLKSYESKFDRNGTKAINNEEILNHTQRRLKKKSFSFSTILAR